MGNKPCGFVAHESPRWWSHHTNYKLGYIGNNVMLAKTQCNRTISTDIPCISPRNTKFSKFTIISNYILIPIVNLTKNYFTKASIYFLIHTFNHTLRKDIIFLVKDISKCCPFFTIHIYLVYPCMSNSNLIFN